MSLTVKILQRPPTADKILKQLKWGVVRGLTETAKEGQTAVLGALRHGPFTIRNRWPEVGPFKIAIKPASTKEVNPTAEIRTRADWLALHETGGIKTGRGGHRLAIPGEDVKRTKRLIIQKGQRPKALLAKGAFIIKTSRGDVIAMRQGRGKNKKLKFLYNLEPTARIKKQSTFFEPIKKVVSRRLQSNVNSSIRRAMKEIR